MQIIRSIDEYDRSDDLLLSIGVFDGVHLGHRAVLRSLVEQRRPGTLVGALTFQHHPQAFLHPESAPKVITTADEKTNLLDECGLDILFLLPFDERIAELEPEAFLRDMLLRRLHTKLLVVGDNWRFGKGRTGDGALAKRVFEAEHCRFEAAALAEGAGDKISSSRIRALIEARSFAQHERLREDGARAELVVDSLAADAGRARDLAHRDLRPRARCELFARAVEQRVAQQLARGDRVRDLRLGWLGRAHGSTA